MPFSTSNSYYDTLYRTSRDREKVDEDIQGDNTNIQGESTTKVENISDERKPLDPIDPSVPESTILSGRFFINLTDIVEPNWWKQQNDKEVVDTNGDDNEVVDDSDEGVTENNLLFRMIGGESDNVADITKADVSAATTGEYEVQVYPTLNPQNSKRINLTAGFIFEKVQRETALYSISIQVQNVTNAGDADFNKISIIIFGKFPDGISPIITSNAPSSTPSTGGTAEGKEAIGKPTELVVQETESYTFPGGGEFERNQTYPFRNVQMKNVGYPVGFKLVTTTDNQLDIAKVSIKSSAFDVDYNYGTGFSISTGDGVPSEFTSEFIINEELEQKFEPLKSPDAEVRNKAMIKFFDDYLKSVEAVKDTATETVEKSERDMNSLRRIVERLEIIYREEEKLKSARDGKNLEEVQTLLTSSDYDGYDYTKEQKKAINAISKYENIEEFVAIELNNFTYAKEAFAGLEIIKKEGTTPVEPNNILTVAKEEFVVARTKYAMESVTLSVTKNFGSPNVDLDRELLKFLRQDKNIPFNFFLDKGQDSIGFHGQVISSTNFEIDVDISNLGSIGSQSITLPTFGLMVRETLEKTSKYFALLFIQSKIPAAYSICTVVRDVDGGVPRQTGCWYIGSSINESKLKITRSNDLFEGYFDATDFNERKIGEAQLVIREASAKAKVDFKSIPGRSAEFSSVRKVLNCGLAFFPLPLITIDTKVVPRPLAPIISYTQPEIRYLISEEEEGRLLSSGRTFSVVEYYNVSIFTGKYGAGRTLNTLTLLPGEESVLSFSSYKDATSTISQSSTVFDEVTEETAAELEDEIEREQSNEQQTEDSMSFHTEASGSYSGYGATVSASVGYETNSSTARQEMARSLTRGIKKHATKASSKRTVEVNSTETSEVKTGSASSVTRNIQNINNSKPLTFTFRQMNQEYISVLHLINIKVAYIGGGDGTYAESPISNLSTFIGRYIKDDQVAAVVEDITEKVKNIVAIDESGAEKREEVLEQIKTGLDEDGKITSISAFNKQKESTVPDYTEIKVPGYIISTDTNVLRTDGIVTETRLSSGIALDQYGFEIQDTDIAERKAKTNLVNAQSDLLQFQKQLISETEDEQVRVKYHENINLLEPKYLAHKGFGPEEEQGRGGDGRF